MEPIVDIDGNELLLDLDQEVFYQTYKGVTDKMQTNHDWCYLSGSYKGGLAIDYRDARFTKVESAKHLGLGRSTFYDRFLEQMTKQYGHRVHQNDYMVWVAPSDPYGGENRVQPGGTLCAGYPPINEIRKTG